MEKSTLFVIRLRCSSRVVKAVRELTLPEVRIDFEYRAATYNMLRDTGGFGALKTNYKSSETRANKAQHKFAEDSTLQQSQKLKKLTLHNIGPFNVHDKSLPVHYSRRAFPLGITVTHIFVLYRLGVFDTGVLVKV